jgi:acetolactate synthase-1/2/3 large subunit
MKTITGENKITTSEALLDGLMEVGVDYIFGNFGTDYAPMIEAMARRNQIGATYPVTFLIPHENVAIHMAGGYAMATGKAQAVMVHVDAGTANSAMGAHNLFRSRVPVILIAGKAPFTIRGELVGSRDTYVHFVQDPFDQNSVVRPYVKWDYNLPHGVITKEVLRRAHSVSQSDPQGPVYLTIPREVMAMELDAEAVRSFGDDHYGRVPARGTDQETVNLITQKLLTAKNPVLITSYSGRNPACPAVIGELAEMLGIKVFEASPYYLNIDHDHPCFMGYSVELELSDVDIGLLVDVDVPWMPRYAKENPKTYWIHLDSDTLKRAMPMWGYPSSLNVEGNSDILLQQVLDAMKAEMTASHRKHCQNRLNKIKDKHDDLLAQAKQLAMDPGEKGAINPHYLCAAVNRAMRPDDILVHEAVMSSPAVFAQIARTQPGTSFGLGGGGLGFSGGAALGIKLANMDKRVIHVIGDGSFYFSTPTAVYSASAAYKLPIFTIIFENGGWKAVKDCTLKVYPDGAAHETQEFQSLLLKTPHFEKIAEAFGGYGERVEDPEKIDSAIARCMQAIEENRSAILVVSVTRL